MKTYTTNIDIITGKDVRRLSYTVQNKVAEIVSKELEKRPNTMLQYSPEMLINTMQAGKTAIILNKSFELLAFSQIWHYGYSDEEREIFEAGSWLSFAPGGNGRKVLSAVVAVGRQLNPQAQIVGIVERGNLRAQKVIEFLGGKEAWIKESSVIKDPSGNPAIMKVYDITDIWKSKIWNS